MKKQRASASAVRSEIKRLRRVWGWTPSDLITLLRGGGNPKKGGQYEREICGELSRWWSGGTRDDLFWRSAASGGRATVRGRRGLQTAGHYGDIAATDPRGEPLTRRLCIELKRGYSEHTIHDLIDRPAGAAVQVWEGFFAQADTAATAAGAFAWLVVNKRDRRLATVWYPHRLHVRCSAPACVQVVTVEGRVCGALLVDFLHHVTPDQIRGLPCSPA